MMKSLIGFLMRVYRASPLYPQLGRKMAWILSVANRFRSSASIIHVVDGITYELDLAEVIDSSLYYSGTFERHAERAISSCIEQGMVAIDIGANFGYHTFRMSRLAGPNGRVLAIEPTTWAMNKLKRNSCLNPSLTNIKPIQVGLVESERGTTEVKFQSSYRLDGSCGDVRELVRMTSLDIVVKENSLDRVDFIKLDVDGFEGKVLSGAEETIRAFHPVIFFEISPDAMRGNGDDPHALLTSLKSHGYKFSAEDGTPISDIILYCGKIPKKCSANLLAEPM